MEGSKKRIKQDVMKTVEEKLKIWSSYLPYNLETAYCDRFGDILTVGSLNNIQYNESETHPLRLSIEGLYELEHEWMFKPFLWDIDMLTKEIEHKGERFIPLVKLAEIEAGEHSCDEVDESINDEGYAFYIEYLPSWFGLYFNKHKYTFTRWDDGEGKDSCSNELRDKLLEWNFNVFGLDESEYITKYNL